MDEGTMTDETAQPPYEDNTASEQQQAEDLLAAATRESAELKDKVLRTLADLKNQDNYASLTYDEASGQYHWQSALAPTEQKDEMALRKAGRIKPEQCR